MKIHRYILIGLCIIPTFGIAQATNQHSTEHAHANKKEAHDSGGKHEHKTPHWAKSLSAEQKKKVDDMHHELDRVLEPLKTDEKLKQKELNELTIKDTADLNAINRKIDELMAIKNNILRHRYAHLVEMRVILNDEQRITYDEAIMQRDKIK